MKFQNKQNRGNRVPRNNQRNDRPRNPKGNQNDGPTDKPFKKRFIKRDQPGQGKPGHAKGPKKGHNQKRKPEDRDLDRELRDYWVGTKGSKVDGGNFVLTLDAKELARQKLDSEMDSYWKQKKDEA